MDGWVGKWQILNPTGRCENEKLEKDKWWGLEIRKVEGAIVKQRKELYSGHQSALPWRCR